MLIYFSRGMEKYPRGRRGGFAKALGRATGARVRIPPSPPRILNIPNGYSGSFFCFVSAYQIRDQREQKKYYNLNCQKCTPKPLGKSSEDYRKISGYYVCRVQDKLDRCTGSKDPEHLPRNVISQIDQKQNEDIYRGRDNPDPEKSFRIIAHIHESKYDEGRMIDNCRDALDHQTRFVCFRIFFFHLFCLPGSNVISTRLSHI